MRERRKAELEELTKLTGKTLDEWQDEARAEGNDANPDASVGYARLMHEIQTERRNAREMHIPIYLLGLLAAGGTVWMRYRGMI